MKPWLLLILLGLCLASIASEKTEKTGKTKPTAITGAYGFRLGQKIKSPPKGYDPRASKVDYFYTFDKKLRTEFGLDYVEVLINSNKEVYCIRARNENYKDTTRYSRAEALEVCEILKKRYPDLVHDFTDYKRAGLVFTISETEERVRSVSFCWGPRYNRVEIIYEDKGLDI